MAEAIIKGITGSGLVAGSAIAVGEHGAERCAYLKETYGVNATTDNNEAVREADLVIFAVKPQVAPVAITSELVANFKAEAWVLSIMGSVTLEMLHN